MPKHTGGSNPSGLVGMMPHHLAGSDTANKEPSTALTDGAANLDPIPTPRPPKKRFAQPWARKPTPSGGEEGAKGSLGLRLLRSSPEPLIDLIFVHGLKGGSSTTWRKGGDPRNFWPQAWLPMEAGLRNASIHTFGYDSDWTNSNSSILNINDFGQSLLEEMRNSPHLRKNKDGPIILIGHSMGGLVIKKAFILSKDTPEFSKRIRSIFFLATPHRGSAFASILKNIVRVSGVFSAREYIADLTTGSLSSQRINEGFARFADELSIFSFYETIRIGPGLVVERDSAILGSAFKTERAQYITANHKDICKFDSPEDAGYKTLKHALIGATQDIIKDVIKSKSAASKAKLQSLKSFLGVVDRQEEHHVRAKGSCQWLHQVEDFQDWREPSTDLSKEPSDSVKPSVFWIHANPGTGKTILAAHVVEELAKSGFECAYYFFRFGNQTSRSPADFLRSIAYQMSNSNAAVREKMVALMEGDLTFDKDDARNIWDKFFQKGIFQASIQTAQYWVIDAIDECGKYRELFTMLNGLRLDFPLRIFITSRKISDLQTLSSSLETVATVVCREVAPKDIMADIEDYIHDRARNLSSSSVAENNDLMATLLQRANGNFLWVTLVLDELETVYSEESILRIIESIPEGMVPYYERVVRVMSENKHEKAIAKGVLLWSVASLSTLTITELSEALEMDIGAKLNSARGAIEGLCGQLVSVDEQSGLIELVHPTVREFLLSAAAGEYTVSEVEANKRIALTCLEMLSSNDMQPPRNRRQLARHTRGETPPLLHYAATNFSEHIYASVAEDGVLLTLAGFLKSNILSWIELMAQSGDLHPLIRVSKNLLAYVVCRAKYNSPLRDQVEYIESWATDLSRVATKFGKALLQSPSSIYYIIPPLCPTSSAISRHAASRSDGLTVVGNLAALWDDCIASVTFEEDDAAVTVSCGERLMGVGMESGGINIYDFRNSQKEGVVEQKHSIDLIHFTDDLMIISTIRTLATLNLDGTVKWQIKIRFRCILLTSTATSVIAVCSHGHVMTWDILTGTLIEDQSFDYMHPDNDPGYAPSAAAPGSASLSPDMELLALGYRWGTICLWDMEMNELVISVRDMDNNSEPVLLFNLNTSIDLLLAVYKQRELILYETANGDLVRRQGISGASSIISVACSPDGRTIASTNTHGTLQIWDFESLNLLYQVATPPTSFRTLQFSSDSSSIIDVVDSGMRLWAPTILMRRNIQEYENVNDHVPDLAVIEGVYEATRSARVTALCAHPFLPIVFVGKPNGQVVAFDCKTGTDIMTMYSHPNDALIREIIISKTNVLASRDVNGRVQVWQLLSTGKPNIQKSSLLLEIYPKSHIRQICFSSGANFLLVAMARSEMVYSIKDKSCVGTLGFGASERSIYQWFSVTDAGVEDGEQFGLLEGRSIRRFSASNFPKPLDTKKAELDYNIEGDIQKIDITGVLMSIETQALVINTQNIAGFVPSSTTFLIGLEDLNAVDAVAQNIDHGFTKHCKHFIGVVEKTKRFLFLDHDSWLCSVDLHSLANAEYTRHFLVPNEFTSAIHSAMPVRASDDSIVFCLPGGLAVVRHGMNFRETRRFSPVSPVLEQ